MHLNLKVDKAAPKKALLEQLYPKTGDMKRNLVIGLLVGFAGVIVVIGLSYGLVQVLHQDETEKEEDQSKADKQIGPGIIDVHSLFAHYSDLFWRMYERIIAFIPEIHF